MQSSSSRTKGEKLKPRRERRQAAREAAHIAKRNQLQKAITTEAAKTAAK